MMSLIYKFALVTNKLKIYIIFPDHCDFSAFCLIGLMY